MWVVVQVGEPMPRSLDASELVDTLNMEACLSLKDYLHVSGSAIFLP